jgi:hypothetical protein
MKDTLSGSMTKVYRRRSLLAIVLILLSLVGVVAVNRAYAQSQAGGVPDAIRDLQNALTTALTNLQNSVNAIHATNQANVRFTPPVFVDVSDLCRCKVVNVTSAAKTITLELLSDIGTVVQANTVSVPPGSVFRGTAAGGARGLYCKFTVSGGSRTDIRGSIAIRSTGSDTLSVPAE